MSIWSKILGFAADWFAGDSSRPERDPTRSIAFTIGVVVLSAKMAKADGRVTADEVAAFWRVVDVPERERANVARLFNIARRDAQGFQRHARKLGDMFKGRKEVLEELLACLMMIANADHVVQEEELAFLREVAELFGFTAAEFDRIRTAELGPDPGDPYFILGISADADDDSVRAAHRRLAREHHPDRLIAEGVPPEFIDLATRRMAAINAAYDRIREMRAQG